MNSVHVEFPCGDITLEGEWHFPGGEGPFPAVVVCHPHPLHGGSMSAPVIVAVCRALAEQNIIAFRFNFRGVGDSGGSYGEGIAEPADVRAALSLVLASPGVETGKIGLAGYSFGAAVALPVAVQEKRVSHLALVSPALSEAGWGQLKGYERPKFLIIGDADFVIPQELFCEHIRAVAEPRRYQVIPGADHFWSGYITVVAERVTDFFVSGFR